MTESRLRIARLFGIPISVDASWFLIFALVTFSLASSYFPARYPHWSPMAYWIVGLITSLLFFLSVLLHELAHSLMTQALGQRVRGITLFIFGGVAELEGEPRRAIDEFLIAAVGPATSVALGVGFFLLGWLAPVAQVQVASRYLGFVNILLALFNLIPGFPLDGGRILRSLVWAVTGSFTRASRIASGVGEVIAWLFILVGALLALRGLVFNGLWLAFIGWFLLNAARASYRQVVLEEVLKNVHVQDCMRTHVPLTSPEETLASLVKRILREGERAYLVAADGRVLGIVTLKDVRKVPPEVHPVTSVVQIMTPTARLRTVPPSATLWDAFRIMTEEDIHQIPVVDELHRLLGLVRRNDILRHMQMRSELGHM
ncbi:MAG: site-2 protease family protein [Ardenticatenia bacterium]|nr:site-2 protease family protein [Ardenticatenia bacterium]